MVYFELLLRHIASGIEKTTKYLVVTIVTGADIWARHLSNNTAAAHWTATFGVITWRVPMFHVPNATFFLPINISIHVDKLLTVFCQSYTFATTFLSFFLSFLFISCSCFPFLFIFYHLVVVISLQRYLMLIKVFDHDWNLFYRSTILFGERLV
jgi:hypothetical protein